MINEKTLIDEQKRISAAYKERKPLKLWQQDNLLYMEQRKIATWAKVFQRPEFSGLEEAQILDVGCGNGSWLRMLCEWGADPGKVRGIDLLPDRIAVARRLAPARMEFDVGTSWKLPYGDESVSICAASTVLSSVLQTDARKLMTAEMQRVLKHNGYAMIFDFAYANPRNRDTIGIQTTEVKRLFDNLNLIDKYYLIVFPPLIRIIPSRLRWFCMALEQTLPFLCSHRLFLLKKNRIQANSHKADES